MKLGRISRNNLQVFRGIQTPCQQRQAANALLQGCDVLAVLPMGFGTNLIFQPFVVTAATERNQHQTMLVICSLQSIINDQIVEATRMGMSATLIANIQMESQGQPNLSFCLAQPYFSLRHKSKLSKYIATIPSASVRR